MDQKAVTTDERRYTVDPMYSAIAVLTGSHAGPVRSASAAGPRDGQTASEPLLEGHVYEISRSGMRFELDEPLASGLDVSFATLLPGMTEPICGCGRVTRVFDAVDDPGARRMVIRFTSFESGHAEALDRYLAQNWLRPAGGDGLGDDQDVASEPTCEVMIETNESTGKGSKSRKSASAA